MGLGLSLNAQKLNEGGHKVRRIFFRTLISLCIRRAYVLFLTPLHSSAQASPLRVKQPRPSLHCKGSFLRGENLDGCIEAELCQLLSLSPGIEQRGYEKQVVVLVENVQTRPFLIERGYLFLFTQMSYPSIHTVSIYPFSFFCTLIAAAAFLPSSLAIHHVGTAAIMATTPPTRIKFNNRLPPASAASTSAHLRSFLLAFSRLDPNPSCVLKCPARSQCGMEGSNSSSGHRRWPCPGNPPQSPPPSTPPPTAPPDADAACPCAAPFLFASQAPYPPCA